ncbi:hypothetical protein DFH28DRAFT_948079 [Melampsora americana]|nr:hypothetical protein DFH28DRAFT_948079 [Melampsora americana]
MMFDEISRWREGTPPSFSFDTMDQHPMSLQSPNGSSGMDSAPSNGFPPRHIEGQCVHRWPSSLSKTTPPQMVFYHQASRCKWHQQRGGLTGPSLYKFCWKELSRSYDQATPLSTPTSTDFSGPSTQYVNARKALKPLTISYSFARNMNATGTSLNMNFKAQPHVK